MKLKFVITVLQIIKKFDENKHTNIWRRKVIIHSGQCKRLGLARCIRGVMWEPCRKVYRSGHSDNCVSLLHYIFGPRSCGSTSHLYVIVLSNL